MGGEDHDEVIFCFKNLFEVYLKDIYSYKIDFFFSLIEDRSHIRKKERMSLCSSGKGHVIN